MVKTFIVSLLAIACFIEGYHIYWHEHCPKCEVCEY